MFIGYIEDAKFEYYRAGSDTPLQPSIADGCTVWDWKKLYNSALDIRVSLGRECFVGSVTLPFSGYTKVYGIEIYSGNSLISRYMAEPETYFTTDKTVSVGATLSAFTIRLYDAFSTITLGKIRISAAYEDGAPLIWPTPKNAEFGEGRVKISGISCSADPAEVFAAELLSEGLSAKLGALPENERGVPVSLKLSPELEKERLVIEVTESEARITAGAPLSLNRAACILAAICEGGSLPICKIDDTPTLEMRGFHIGLPKRENIDFAKKLYRYVLLPLGYNQLIVQFCGGMRYDRHPEITEAWLEGNRLAREGKQPTFPHDYMGAEGTVLEKDEVRGLLDYARSLGFEIIPEVQSLGHVQYITYAHPEIGERDENETQVKDTRAEDLRPSEFFTHCYCPSNEKSYEIIFDIMEEIIEVARPERYLHIGHDEVYHLGVCPKCRGKSHADLFVSDVMRLYNFLKERGLGTMMWGDMLQPTTKYETKPSIDMLPKDIVQLDFIWYFHLGLDIEDNLLEKGYKVGIGNLYSSHFPRYKSRALKDGMIGGQLSTWCAVNEYAMGKKGKFWDATYTAEMLCRPELYDPDMRWIYSHIISKYIQPVQRDLIRGKWSPKGWSRKDIALPYSLGKGVPEVIRKNRPNATVARDIRVEVGESFERIRLESACLNIGLRIPWEPLYISGTVTLEYEDGTKSDAPLEYAGGTHYIKRRYGEPFPEPAHRHTGYSGTWFADPSLEITYDGAPYLLTELIIENPKPEKKIKAISYKPTEDDYTKVIIASICGSNRK